MAVDLSERARSELSPAEAASEEEVVKNTAAVSYAGGADTVTNFSLSLCMLAHFPLDAVNVADVLRRHDSLPRGAEEGSS